ncbi:MAG: type II toxin-antitoxin system RelE/ParE family toxin [Candidatus Binatia bacterium]
MAVSSLKVAAEVRSLIRRLPPELKRKVRAALADVLVDPGCGKALKENLQGYWSLRVGRSRIIYRPIARGVEIVAIGPRETIYEDAARQVFREREKA